MDSSKKLEGTKLVIIQSMLGGLNRLAEEMGKLRYALDETVTEYGKELLGGDEDGVYTLDQLPSGELVIVKTFKEGD